MNVHRLAIPSLVFIIVSILDVLLTQKVLELGGYEANPLAELFAPDYLFHFKAVIVSLTIAAVFSADHGRPEDKCLSWVLWLGTALTTLVNIYSTILIVMI